MKGFTLVALRDFTWDDGSKTMYCVLFDWTAGSAIIVTDVKYADYLLQGP